MFRPMSASTTEVTYLNQIFTLPKQSMQCTLLYKWYCFTYPNTSVIQLSHHLHPSMFR